MPRFNDKVVLITGALGGIGAATVQWIAKGGARLALTDINKSAADVPADITAGDVRCIDIGPGIAATAGSYPDGHGDPADRLILASAAAERVALVTKDRRLRAMAQSAGVRTIW